MSLQFDFTRTEIPQKYPDPDVHFEITAGKTGPMAFLSNFTGRYARKIDSAESVHFTAVDRYQNVKVWRPEALKPIGDEVMAVDVEQWKRDISIDRLS